MPQAPTQTHSDQAPCSVVVGLQWGDEGKGKLVDLLAADHDAVVRYNGGANAGHSVVVAGTRYSLHLIPSGILYPGKAAVIGNGVVVDPWKLAEELDGLAQRGVDTSGLMISSRAHAVLAYHKLEDGLREDLLKRVGAERAPSGPDQAQGAVPVSEIGTTRRGIGPAYADKVQRACAVRMCDLSRPEQLREKLSLALALKDPMLRVLAPNEPKLELNNLLEQALSIGQRLSPMVRDTTQVLHTMLRDGKRILFEGANGSLLDVDHGTYPYVTGSTCIASGVGPGTGVPATRLGRVLGVMKAYSTRVGSGPMPTELKNDIGDTIRVKGREFGTTTGRPRRVGWLDLVAVRYSAMVNGATGMALTMLDVLAGMDELMVCSAYKLDGRVVREFPPDAFDLTRVEPVYTSVPGFSQELGNCRSKRELPAGARRYVEMIEGEVGVPVDVVSVGPGREQTILS